MLHQIRQSMNYLCICAVSSRRWHTFYSKLTYNDYVLADERHNYCNSAFLGLNGIKLMSRVFVGYVDNTCMLILLSANGE